jgi:hypothetical protein
MIYVLSFSLLKADKIFRYATFIPVQYLTDIMCQRYESAHPQKNPPERRDRQIAKVREENARKNSVPLLHLGFPLAVCLPFYDAVDEHSVMAAGRCAMALQAGMRQSEARDDHVVPLMRFNDVEAEFRRCK